MFDIIIGLIFCLVGVSLIIKKAKSSKAPYGYGYVYMLDGLVLVLIGIALLTRVTSLFG